VSTSKNIIVDINKRAAADGKRRPVGPAAQGWGLVGWQWEWVCQCTTLTKNIYYFFL